jgi:monofunctional biosynthetic peptidoglycan transglycosylase
MRVRTRSQKRKTGKPKKQGRIRKIKNYVKWGIRLALLLFIIDIFYLYHIWPDYDAIKRGRIPESNYIKQYRMTYRMENKPPLHWRRVPISRISPNVQKAVVIAEDIRFYYHRGFDLEAVIDAMAYNWKRGRFAYGGSTLSQQTIKNLYLSHSKDPLRKWHELILTVGMEFNLDKQRILELYLNIAEFGPGVFGVESAARHYWGIPASQLSMNQAIQLAATLPSPRRNNPATRTRSFQHRVEKISRNVRLYEKSVGAR